MPTTARLRLLLATACLAIAPTAPADAALFQQVYTGTVTGGYDGLGVFSGAGEYLTGLAYTATYVIDDSKGNRGGHDLGYSYVDGFEAVQGGSYYYGLTPSEIPNGTPVSAKLTINGKTILIDGDNFGSASEGDYTIPYGADQLNIQARSNTDAKNMYHNVSSDYDLFSGSGRFGTPFDFASDRITSGFGAFEMGGGYGTYATFDIARAVSSPAAVPEPAAWALMIGGFGLVGGTLRRTGRVAKRSFATA